MGKFEEGESIRQNTKVPCIANELTSRADGSVNLLVDSRSMVATISLLRWVHYVARTPHHTGDSRYPFAR